MLRGDRLRNPTPGRNNKERPVTVPGQTATEQSRPAVVTFDCYGTLIDWESGIRDSFRQASARIAPVKLDDTRIFEFYKEEERKIESEESYRPYRQVLGQAVIRAARRVGWRMSEEQSHFLAEDLPMWKPFPDTNPALKRLAEGHRLGILSNVDNDLLAGTMKNLAVPFQIVITAEQVRSYKPKPEHFETARRLIGGQNWLHVAASTYHDIEPARRLGIGAIWVNRKGAPIRPDFPRDIQEVNTLTELADWLE